MVVFKSFKIVDEHTFRYMIGQQSKKEVELENLVKSVYALAVERAFQHKLSYQFADGRAIGKSTISCHSHVSHLHDSPVQCTAISAS